MNLKFILTTLYILSPVAFSNEWVYTWTSKNNKVHYYSDKPQKLIPEISDYILINSSLYTKNNNNYSKKYVMGNESEHNLKIENCKNAKRNFIITKKANSLSEKDKNSILKIYQNDINKYCD